MPDQSTEPGGRTAGHRLDSATRERLLTLLQDELAHASHETLARGASPDVLAAVLEDRIAWLRAEIAAVPAEGSPPDA